MTLAGKQGRRVEKNMAFEMKQIGFESWFCSLLGNLELSSFVQWG